MQIGVYVMQMPCGAIFINDVEFTYTRTENNTENMRVVEISSTFYYPCFFYYLCEEDINCELLRWHVFMNL